jgi:hypothetical protein
MRLILPQDMGLIISTNVAKLISAISGPGIHYPPNTGLYKAVAKVVEEKVF